MNKSIQASLKLILEVYASVHRILCEAHTSFLTRSIGSYTLFKILHSNVCIQCDTCCLLKDARKSKTVNPDSRKNYRLFWVSTWSCKSIIYIICTQGFGNKLIKLDAQNNKIIDNHQFYIRNLTTLQEKSIRLVFSSIIGIFSEVQKFTFWI